MGFWKVDRDWGSDFPLAGSFEEVTILTDDDGLLGGHASGDLLLLVWDGMKWNGVSVSASSSIGMVRISGVWLSSYSWSKSNEV